MARKITRPTAATEPAPPSPQARGAAITARAYELMEQASSDRRTAIIAAKEKAKGGDIEPLPPLPGWADFLALAAQQIDGSAAAAPVPPPAPELTEPVAEPGSTTTDQPTS